MSSFDLVTGVTKSTSVKGNVLESFLKLGSTSNILPTTIGMRSHIHTNPIQSYRKHATPCVGSHMLAMLRVHYWSTISGGYVIQKLKLS